MQIFDTHCHYNLSPLLENWQQHQQTATSAGVKKSLIVGTNLASSRQALEIVADNNSSLYAAIGIHPTEAMAIEDFDQTLQELTALTEVAQVKAIGEIGLDFYRLATSLDPITEIQKQEQLFIRQLELATRLQLPIVLHVRDQAETAYLRALELYHRYASNHQQAVIFHCVSGPTTYLEKALALPNSYFGFDGNLTFKNASNIREIFTLVQKRHPEKILLETDAPYLAPEPHRGKVCEPAMIALTAAFAAANLGADLEQIYHNSLQVFDLLS